MVAKPSKLSSQGIFLCFRAEDGFAGILFLFVNPIPALVSKVLTQLISVSMRQRTQVRLKRLGQRMLVDLAPAKLRHPVFEFAKYPVFRFASKQAIVRQNHVSQEVHPLTGIEDGAFLGMQRELQFVPDNIPEWVKETFQIFFVGGNYHKVVGVARVMFDLQIMLNELVEFVHVNVGEQLRSKIADRQTMTLKERRLSGRKASNNLLHKPHGIRVDYPLLENRQQNLVINRIEKLSHIAFEREARPCVVSAFSSDHALGGQHALVRSFADTTRKRIGDKGLLKNGVQDSENRMVQNSVPHRGLVNVAHFRIADIETRIRPVGVAFGSQIPMQRKEILLKRKLESLNIGFLALVASKFLPRRNDVFERYDPIE
jgi:hypothetical protein